MSEIRDDRWGRGGLPRSGGHAPQMDSATFRNFPQAATHPTLISPAGNPDRALQQRSMSPGAFHA